MIDISTMDRFKLDGRVGLITGSAGLLGKQHAIALLDAGASIVCMDINADKLSALSQELSSRYPSERILTITSDITDKQELINAKDKILNHYGSIDILINNASNNPKVEVKEDNLVWSRFENFPIEAWDFDLAVGITGAFLCCQIFGNEMKIKKSGVIINVSSDLGVIAPDQRIYRKEGIDPSNQEVKPVTYSVIKHAIIGLTKYLATYWSEYNIRVNAISPGGVFNNQPEEFLSKLQPLIPMGRMADVEEYRSAILFLASDASSYMTGSNLIIDGGRTCW